MAAAETFDVLITNGRVVDGTGAPWHRADIGITGDRITAIGRLAGRDAKTRIDAANLVVAPGFIDMLGQSEFNVLADPRAASKITQGITTEITGEGSSIAPLNDALATAAQPQFDRFKVALDFRTLGEYFARLERNRPALNVGTFVGAGGLRGYVVGQSQRAATPAEIEQMKTLVAQAMEQGALGVSTSLQYVPGRFASTDEIVELAKVAQQHGGIYISHQRSESNQIIVSLDEVFAVAERANIPAEVWHLKTAYRANWGRMGEVLAHFDAARARGLDVTANMYPYDRASNGLDACLPLWVREGGLEQMLQRLTDPALRGAALHVAARRQGRDRRSRPAASRVQGRHHDLQSRYHPRSIDVRRSHALLGRRRARARQRHGRGLGRKDHHRAARRTRSRSGIHALDGDRHQRGLVRPWAPKPWRRRPGG